MPHATATFHGQVIADSDTYQTVEGNIYFPPSSLISQSHFSPSTLTTVCPWKGTASYYNISVNRDEAKDAAWYYPEPTTEKAKDLGIQGWIAFCRFLLPDTSRETEPAYAFQHVGNH
ncbi:MAG: hypothetical protein Q9203_003540 [Teloschistes exilis]